MDAKYRITITDLNSGELINADGLRGSFETRFGLVCAFVHSENGGSGFAQGLIGGSKFTSVELYGMAFTALQCLGRAARQAAEDPEKYNLLVTAITSAFHKWLDDELGKPDAALMLAWMSMLSSGMDPVPAEGEP